MFASRLSVERVMSDPIACLNAALSGRYRVERELGEGGMATVYLADDVRHGRKVALKVLKPELAAIVGAAPFLAEIRTTASLQHPHILPLFDSGEADGLLFYVMPHVEGESLRDRLDRERQLPVDVALEVATTVAPRRRFWPTSWPRRFPYTGQRRSVLRRDPGARAGDRRGMGGGRGAVVTGRGVVHPPHVDQRAWRG